MVDARALGHGDRVLQLHRLRIAEVEPLQRFGDDDRRLAVRARSTCCTDRRPGSPCRACRSSDRSGSGCRRCVLGVVGDPQRLRSHDGTTCCGLRPTLNLSTTLNVAGIDHVDVVGLDVRHVDARQVAGDRRLHLAGRRSRCRDCAASGTGGMPGTVDDGGGAALAGARLRGGDAAADSASGDDQRERRASARATDSRTIRMLGKRIDRDTRARRATALRIASTVCATIASTPSWPSSALDAPRIAVHAVGARRRAAPAGRCAPSAGRARA